METVFWMENAVTYDIEFYGPNTMTNTIYLGAIKGVVEMQNILANRILQINIVLCMKRLLY